MAIQHRRGSYGDLDPTKAVPGEVLVVLQDDPTSTDGKAAYMAFSAGNIKRMATYDEVRHYNEDSREYAEEARGYKNDAQTALAATQTAATNAANSASAAATSESNAQTILDNATTVITNTKNAAVAAAESEIDDIKDDALDDIEEKKQEILGITTAAETIATNAMTKADDVENHLAECDSKIQQLEADMQDVSIDVDDLGLYQDENTYYVYPMYKGQISENGIPLQGTGGGSGGGSGGDTIGAVLTVTNTSGWLSKTVANNSACVVTLNWSSIEDNLETGDGTARISVNGVVKSVQAIQQGNISLNIAPYLATGQNKVKVRISDTYDQGKTITYNITVVALSISSSFETSNVFDSSITFTYTPVGAVEKTVHFILDGTQIGTQTTSVSGRQLAFTIPAQSHGSHAFRVYFDATINAETVYSNELYYEFISIAQGNSTPIIASSFNQTTFGQYSTINIPYRVYLPTSDSAEVKLYINDVLVSTQTVDRTEQTYTIRANTAGALKFEIKCGNVTKTFNMTITEADMDVAAETEDLVLYLNAIGRSNSEETKSQWNSGNIEATLSGFNWRRDGWQLDKDGVNVLRLEDTARVTIPYKPFETDFKSTGKTIEIEFATRQVSNYNATIMSCMSEGIGFSMTSQQIVFSGAQTSTNTLYKDNEHVRISITVGKQSDNRLILIYVNGIISRAIQYASGERFSQLTPVNISIGSSDCGIDIYAIRIYDNDLNKQQILDNWIADTQIGELMLQRYTHNAVYDAYGEIPYANLPNDLPYMIIEAEELPQYKGDKKTVSGSFTDPMYPSRSFTFEGCQANVQGTSSAIYYRKNYDLQFKHGFVLPSGTQNTFELRQGSIPFNRFVLKADVASSESANNTKLSMIYNDLCPYKTPEMVENSKVRWGIEGIPIVLYWYDKTTQTTQLMGKLNTMPM